MSETTRKCKMNRGTKKITCSAARPYLGNGPIHSPPNACPLPTPALTPPHVEQAHRKEQQWRRPPTHAGYLGSALQCSNSTCGHYSSYTFSSSYKFSCINTLVNTPVNTPTTACYCYSIRSRSIIPSYQRTMIDDRDLGYFTVCQCARKATVSKPTTTQPQQLLYRTFLVC